MEQFNLEEYLANPKRKVVTRKGKEVEIISINGREQFPIIGYVDDNQTPSSWSSNGHYVNDGTTTTYDLFFADEEEEPIRWMPSWRRAKAGTKLHSEAVIIYDIDPEPRLGKVMVNDGRYMLVKELEELPEE
jgi:hypothetical protein